MAGWKRKRWLVLAILGLSAMALWHFRCHGRQSVRFRVNHDPGFLIVACYELQYNAITETSHDPVGCDVKRSGPNGEFTLSLPRRTFSGHPAAYLTISKPGFQVFEQLYTPGETPFDLERDNDGVVQITIGRAAAYGDEAVALAQAYPRKYDRLDPVQQRVFEDYMSGRVAYLRDNYPAQVAAAEAQLARRSFRGRASFDRRVCGVAALPGDGMAVLIPGNQSERTLLFLDAQQHPVAEVPLASWSESSIEVSKNELAVFDDGQIRRFDFTGKPLATVTLQPAPRRVDAFAYAPDGFVVHLQAIGDQQEGLGHYSSTGQLLEQRHVPHLREFGRLLVAPDGAVLLFGQLDEDWDYDLFLADRKKDLQALQDGVVRLASWNAEPEVILRGADSVVACGDRLLAYADGMYDSLYENLVHWNVQGYLHQLLLEASWDGEILASHDISDGQVDGLDLGHPLGNRLLFYGSQDVYDLKRDRREAITPCTRGSAASDGSPTN